MGNGIFSFLTKKEESNEVVSSEKYAAEYAAKFVDLSEVPVDFDNIPKHIAIIMDGNGRWAKERKMPRTIGHRNGVVSVDKVVEACKELGVKFVSVYAFSTENWKRSEEEVSTLMHLIVEFANSKLKKICQNDVRVKVLGDVEGLPEFARDSLVDLMNTTENNQGLTLNLCINYGGRWELTEAVKKLSLKVKNNEIDADEIDEAMISKHLTTSSMPDPELMIRTSGEQRLSNYLLWQLAYAEFYFTDVLWPDFREAELIKAISWYQHRDRRFGGVK